MFGQFTRWCAHAVGTPIAFVIAVLGVLVWAVTGPFFHFSTNWQLVVNSTTTVITFWLVFIIQNTQNHDTRAIHIKLDEIILKMEGADNEYVHAELREDKVVEDLDRLHAE